MKEDLVLRLNTLESLAVATPEERERTGLYTNLNYEEAEPYKKGTFDKVIKYCLEQNENSTIDEDKTLAMEIMALLSQNTRETPFQVRVRNENDGFKKNTETMGEVMKLDDKVVQYIEKRTMENGNTYDYLDMVVELNTKVGAKCYQKALSIMNYGTKQR